MTILEYITVRMAKIGNSEAQIYLYVNTSDENIPTINTLADGRNLWHGAEPR